MLHRIIKPIISKKGEGFVEGVHVLSLMSFVAPEEGAKRTGVLNMVHKAANVTLDGLTGDYHSGPTRFIRPYQSALLDGQEARNDRALYVCVAEELGAAASVIDLDECLEGRSSLPDELSQLEDRRDSKFFPGLVMSAVLGCNILLTDPQGKLRERMNPGNVLGFATSEERSQAAILSMRVTGYNIPCFKPGGTLEQLFPELNCSPVTRKRALSVRHGWLVGVATPGWILTGDSVSVIFATLTPELEEFKD